MAYSNVRVSGIIGLKLDDGDSLVSCALGCKDEDVLLSTYCGKAIRFSSEDVRPMGRASRGVTGIRFSDKEDYVVGLEILEPGLDDLTILSVCENGYGKRTKISEYRKQSRGGKGIYTIKVTKRNGGVVAIAPVCDLDHVMVMTSKGKLMRFDVKEVGVIGRLTQGVKLMQVAEQEKVISIGKVSGEEHRDEETEIKKDTSEKGEA